MDNHLIDTLNIPEHIAIIMDGNGRWATQRGKPRTFGHKEGVNAVQRTVEAAAELGVRYITLFGFSTENWKRSHEEVSELMGLLKMYLKSKTSEMHKNNVRLTVIGDRSRLDKEIVRLIENAETLTKDNDKLHVQVALSYSGRYDITQAVQTLARAAVDGKINPDDIDETVFSSALQTNGVPDPDLLIRTSGEKRISNFLLWQCAYSEYYFTDTYWPDFGKDDLVEAIRVYSKRDRRFGAVTDKTNVS